MAGIGLALTLIHSLGGIIVQGLNQGFTALGGRAYGSKNIAAF